MSSGSISRKSMPHFGSRRAPSKSKSPPIEPRPLASQHALLQHPYRHLSMPSYHQPSLTRPSDGNIIDRLTQQLETVQRERDMYAEKVAVQANQLRFLESALSQLRQQISSTQPSVTFPEDPCHSHSSTVLDSPHKIENKFPPSKLFGQSEFVPLDLSPNFVDHASTLPPTGDADTVPPFWRRMLKGVKLRQSVNVASPSSHMPLNEPASPEAPPSILSSLDGWIDTGPIFATSRQTRSAKSREKQPDWSVESNGQIQTALKINLVTSIPHENAVFSVRFSPDGNYLAAGCGNGTAYIYDVKTLGKKSSLIDKFTKELSVRIVCFNIDNKYLATAGSDRQIRIWIIDKKYTRNVFKGHEAAINAIDFSSDSQFLVSSSDDRTVRIWRMRDGFARVFTAGHSIWRSRLSPDGRHVACGCNPWSLQIWDMRTGRLVRKWNGHKEPVESVEFTPDGKGLVTASWDKTLKHWDVGSLGSHSRPESLTRIQRDLRQDGEKHAKKIITFNGHTNYVSDVSISHDGRWVASGSWDDTVRIWRLRNATMEYILHGHKNVVWSVDFSPVGGYLATAGGDHQLALWEYTSN